MTNHRPRMTLAAALLAATLAADGVRAEIFIGNTTGSPTWTRPQVSGTSVSGAIVRYDALQFHVSISATYTLIATPQSAAFDVMQFLFDKRFNPGAPLVGFLAGEDDGDDGGSETLLYFLSSGTTYHAVTTGFVASDFGSYLLSFSGPDLVTPGAAPTAAADFDEDGDVDGNDLTRWRNNFGTGATHMQGNADNDQDVDGADFLAWQQQFSSGPALVPADAAVPEPSALMLAGLAALFLLGYRRNCA